MRVASDVSPARSDPVSGSLYERIGALLGLRTPLRSEVDLIERLERGLGSGAVQSLRTRAALTDEETYTLIAPRRTLSRRETLHQVLTREEADKVVRIARVAARAEQAFGGRPEYAAEWLRAPKTALGGRTPLQALATESGGLAVEELLIAIEYGLFG